MAEQVNDSGIRATDDEALAERLWGDNKKWDDERQQYVPVEKGGEQSSPGSSSQKSSDVTGKTEPSEKQDPPSTARTTEPPSKKVTPVSSGAPSTGTSGKAKQ